MQLCQFNKLKNILLQTARLGDKSSSVGQQRCKYFLLASLQTEEHLVGLSNWSHMLKPESRRFSIRLNGLLGWFPPHPMFS
jgi:hypothetical protein